MQEPINHANTQQEPKIDSRNCWTHQPTLSLKKLDGVQILYETSTTRMKKGTRSIHILSIIKLCLKFVNTRVWNIIFLSKSSTASNMKILALITVVDKQLIQPQEFMNKAKSLRKGK